MSGIGLVIVVRGSTELILTSQHGQTTLVSLAVTLLGSERVDGLLAPSDSVIRVSTYEPMIRVLPEEWEAQRRLPLPDLSPFNGNYTKRFCLKNAPSTPKGSTLR